MEPGLRDQVKILVGGAPVTQAFAYWKGAMHFTGEDVQGMGYLEMTGY